MRLNSSHAPRDLSEAINTTSSGNVKIGSDVQSRYFAGVLDEVHIFNYALTAPQIIALMNAPDQSAAAWYRRYRGDAPINWTALGRRCHPQ